MKFEVYGKPTCAKCKSTKEKLDHLMSKREAGEALTLTFVDMDTVDGLAEAAFNDVQDVPTTILRSDSGEVVARWDAQLPPSVEVHAALSGSRV